MKIFEYKSRKLFYGTHLLGFIFVMAGIMALVSPVFVENERSIEVVLSIGTGAVVLGIVIMYSYSGTLIDFANNSFKEYFAVGGIKTGEWAPLPERLTIKVIEHVYTGTNTPNGISPTLSSTITDYRTLIYADTATPKFAFIYKKKELAVKEAKVLSSNLGAEMTILFANS